MNTGHLPDSSRQNATVRNSGTEDRVKAVVNEAAGIIGGLVGSIEEHPNCIVCRKYIEEAKAWVASQGLDDHDSREQS